LPGERERRLDADVQQHPLLIDAAERRELEQLFFDLGVGESFYLSIDPALEVSESLEEMTFYACIPSEPTIRHEIRDRYSIDFDVEEAV
jgi:hypothetical protein